MTRPGRLSAALVVPIMAALLVAGHVNGQSQTPDGSAALDPVCDLAFQLAANVAARPAPGLASPPAVVFATPGSVPIDLAIRSCVSLADWAAGAARYPEALAGSDGLLLLVERCVDPASGLAALPVCAAVAGVPPPSPLPSPSPVPSTSPSEDEASTPRLVRLPRFVTRVRGADRVRTFPIRGESPEALLRAMQEGAARVCPQHASACTLTQPRIRPRVLSNAPTGSCRVTGLEVSADDTVHIPRWSGPRRVFPELVAWWREVNTHVRWHEAQHIKISQRHLASLRKRIVGKSCQRISLEVQRMSQQLGQAHAAFDMRDQGWLPPYDGPLP